MNLPRTIVESSPKRIRGNSESSRNGVHHRRRKRPRPLRHRAPREHQRPACGAQRLQRCCGRVCPGQPARHRERLALVAAARGGRASPRLLRPGMNRYFPRKGRGGDLLGRILHNGGVQSASLSHCKHYAHCSHSLARCVENAQVNTVVRDGHSQTLALKSRHSQSFATTDPCRLRLPTVQRQEASRGPRCC